MKHSRIASFLFPLLLSVACGGSADPIDPDDDVVDPDPDPDPDPEVKTASVRLIDDGQPVVGATVFVHDANGDAREALETNDDGVVSIDDIPEIGVGITFRNDLVDSQGGLSTVFGVNGGDNLTFGSETVLPMVVSYTIPDGFVVAERYEVRAGCQSRFETELGAEGTLGVSRYCALGDTIDAAVLATDEDGETVGYAILRDLPIVVETDQRTAVADFSTSGWSVELGDIQMIGEDMPAQGAVNFSLYAPGRRSALVANNRVVTAEADASPSVAFSMLPELADSTEALWTQIRGNEAGETLSSILARKESMVGQGVGSVNLSTELPGAMEGLTVSSDLTTFAVGRPGAFICETDTTIDATLYTIRARLGSDLVKWQVLAPGTPAACSRCQRYRSARKTCFRSPSLSSAALKSPVRATALRNTATSKTPSTPSTRFEIQASLTVTSPALPQLRRPTSSTRENGERQ